MIIARILGTVVSTQKDERLLGKKLLIVRPINVDGSDTTGYVVAVDAIGAGIGDLVFWCRGKEASFPFKREDTPTDCTIIGIVDSEQHVTR
jgi:microcompartment protein CcmK/EutM